MENKLTKYLIATNMVITYKKKSKIKQLINRIKNKIRRE